MPIRWLLTAIMPLMMLMAGACTSQPVNKPDPGPVLATVNGEAISEDAYNYYLQIRRKHQPAIADKREERNIVLDELIGRRLLVQAAIKSKVDRESDVQQEVERQQQKVRIQAANPSEQDLQLALDHARESVLARGMLRRHMQANPITDQQIKEHTIKNEFRIRYIVVKDRQTAAGIISKVNEGADFAELARSHSIDPANRNKGGALGWISQEDPVDLRLFEAMASIRKGQISQEPAMSHSGWHVFKIDDIRPHQVRSPEQLAKAIRSDLIEREVESLLRNLKATATISIHERPERAG